MELTWLRRSKEVSGHVGSDNDMLNGSNVWDRERGAGVAGLD
jgi:hypothetical protein